MEFDSQKSKKKELTLIVRAAITRHDLIACGNKVIVGVRTPSNKIRGLDLVKTR
jgi:hypothetical protein